MKILKKSLNVFLCFVLLFITFMTPAYSVSAKTVGQMKKELEEQEAAYAQLKEDKAKSEAERKKVSEEIATNEKNLINLKLEKEQLDNEIAELNKKVEAKYNEIKKIINYQQIASGESSYLEYIFGAKSFTDFIYRSSVAEQLSKYNKVLIEGYESDIKKSQDKQAEIDKKQTEINNLQTKLSKQYASLGQEIKNLGDDMTSAEEEIKILKANILEIQNAYGCSDDEEIEVCKQRVIASNYIPPSSGDFIRPINNAIVTANYGYYDPYRTGKPTWHAAMDMASDSRAPIYPAADGKVVEVKHQACGNNIVYIVHNIKGNRYTTGYWHMSSVSVKVGQYVTAYTQIGKQGGRKTEDTCSTGEHLDFLITTGAYKMDYFVSPRSVSVNPRNYIYFPPLVETRTGIGRSKEWKTR